MSTLRTIPGFGLLTPQEVFNRAAKHVLGTGQKAIEPALGQCTYGGVGCAASVFLLPEYRETTAGGWLLVVSQGWAPNTNCDLIRAVQRAHDHSTLIGGSNRELVLLDFMPDFKRRMRNVAEAYGLDDYIIVSHEEVQP